MAFSVVTTTLGDNKMQVPVMWLVLADGTNRPLQIILNHVTIAMEQLPRQSTVR
jgi:hypothetical protein